MVLTEDLSSLSCFRWIDTVVTQSDFYSDGVQEAENLFYDASAHP